ncbi:MAG: hypothetical protein ACT4PJ_07385 [Gemmatimonadaceae bacterium]
MASSHLAMLPSELSERSLSRQDVVMRHDDALVALGHFGRAGLRVESWEGWVRLADGTRAKSLAHQGTFALPLESKASIDVTREMIAQAQQRWNRSPEYAGGELFFKLTVV